MRENPAETRWVKAVSNRNRSMGRRKDSKEIGKETRDLCDRKDEEIMSAPYFAAICIFTIIACKHKENDQMWEMFPLFKCKLKDPKQSLI